MSEARAPARRLWRPIAAFVLLFAIYQTSEALQTWAAPASRLGPVLMVVTVLLAWPVGRWLGWRGYDAYALDLRLSSFGYLAAGMVMAMLAKLAAIAIGVGSGAYATAAHPEPVSLLLPIAFGLLTTFIPSIAEDIITRGLPLRASGIRWKASAFILLSAALYTANHIWRFDWGWTEQLRLFCLGLAYAAAAWRWRTLWCAVALHWGWNFSAVLTDLMLPLQVQDEVGARLISAGVHLALLAVVLLLPAAPARKQG